MSPQHPSDVGLCRDCRFAHVQRSARGSEFWRCRKSDTDPRLLRYPPLPVRLCDGYSLGSPEAEETAGSEGDS